VSFYPFTSFSRTRFGAVATGLVMSKILKTLGQSVLRPIIKLKATCRHNAIIIAHMSPEQLREHKRMHDELRFMREQRSELLMRHKPPGSWF
jgi:hypothetical protein